LANDLAGAYVNKGAALQGLRQLSEAVAELDKAIGILELLVAAGARSWRMILPKRVLTKRLRWNKTKNGMRRWLTTNRRLRRGRCASLSWGCFT
jgi:hypothetical protein